MCCSHSNFVSQNIDVLTLTETWLCCGDNAVLMNYCPLAMIFDMLIGKGEAVVWHSFIKKDIPFRNIVPTREITQFELLDCIIKVNKLSTRLVVVYRPPPSRNNGLRYENFVTKWSSYIEQLR